MNTSLLRRHGGLLVLCFVLCASMAAPLKAAAVAGGNIFQRGRMHTSLTGGIGSDFNQDYFVLGLGLGYYVANGLELGVDGEGWFGSDPHIYKVSPQVRYVFYQNPRLAPYIGAFYQRSYISGVDDLDSYGGRIGFYSRLGSRTYAGAGIVYEKFKDCTETIYNSCSSTRPEFTIGVGF